MILLTLHPTCKMVIWYPVNDISDNCEELLITLMSSTLFVFDRETKKEREKKLIFEKKLGRVWEVAVQLLYGTLSSPFILFFYPAIFTYSVVSPWSGKEWRERSMKKRMTKNFSFPLLEISLLLLKQDTQRASESEPLEWKRERTSRSYLRVYSM